MPNDEAIELTLNRDGNRRRRLVGLVAALVLAALGTFMFYLGVTWQEPTERLGSRSVGAYAPIGLSIAGAIVVLGGMFWVLRATRRN